MTNARNSEAYRTSNTRGSLLNTKPISFKIILIGQSSTGKSSLIRKYIHGQFAKEYHVTVGVDFSSKTVQVGQQFCQLQIWDTCGQDVYHSITKNFYRGACAVFLAYAIKQQTDWIEKFREQGSPHAFVFLIGTKCDLNRQVEQVEAAQFCKNIKGAFFIETSALSGQNVQDLFEKAANLMYKNYQISSQFRALVSPDRPKQNIHLSKRDSNVFPLEKDEQGIPKKKKCCS